MAYLPYAVRHVQRSVEDHILARLTELDWIGDAADVPFGTEVVTFQRGAMVESELVAATGNMVAVSFGSEPDDIPQEMGGGVLMVEHYVFVDVLGVKEAIALAIASDVKDLLAGRAPGTTRYLPVYDYTDDPRTLVVGHRLELTDVTRQEGNAAIKRQWQIVKATIEQSYIGEDDGS